MLTSNYTYPYTRTGHLRIYTCRVTWNAALAPHSPCLSLSSFLCDFLSLLLTFSLCRLILLILLSFPWPCHVCFLLRVRKCGSFKASVKISTLINIFLKLFVFFRRVVYRFLSLRCVQIMKFFFPPCLAFTFMESFLFFRKHDC